jgi:hypothetical protein
MVKLHGHVLEALDHNELNQAEKSCLTITNLEVKLHSKIITRMFTKEESWRISKQANAR